MADLAKIGEVKTFHSGRIGEGLDKLVNEYLAGGWQIVTVKVVEAQFRVQHDRKEDNYIRKEPEIVYVLGKPHPRVVYPPKEDFHQP